MSRIIHPANYYKMVPYFPVPHFYDSHFQRPRLCKFKEKTRKYCIPFYTGPTVRLTEPFQIAFRWGERKPARLVWDWCAAEYTEYIRNSVNLVDARVRTLPVFMSSIWYTHTHTHTHARTHARTHTHLTALCPGLPSWAGRRKVKPIWILLKQETVSGSGISSAICKSASRSRQITTPAPHHSVFYRPDALPELTTIGTI